MFSSLLMVSYHSDQFGWSNWVSLFSALMAFGAVGLASYLTYRYTARHSKITHNTTVRVDQLKRRISALENIWALLAYMSDKKSRYAIVHWKMERCSTSGKKETSYYYHFGNLEQFCLYELSDVFYKQHAGLFISEAVRDQLFAYRHLAGALYFAHLRNTPEETEDGLYPIHKAEQAEKLKQHYNDLNRMLKEELEYHYDELMVKGKNGEVIGGIFK